MLDTHLIAKTTPYASAENIILWGNYRVTVLESRLFRIEQDSERLFCDEATLSVWHRDTPPVPYRTKKQSNHLIITTEDVTLCLDKQFDRSYLLVEGKRRRIDNRGNLLGTFRTLDECNGKWWCHYLTKHHVMKMENGVLSKTGVAVMDDTTTPCLLQNGMPAERRETGIDLYIFAFGRDYRAALRALYRITGATPIIPRYALGNWWSRYHDYTEREYLHVMDRLASRDLPFTVATVDMDWHWSREALDEEKKFAETGKHGPHYGVVANEGRFAGWTGYSWNTRLFPDYLRFLKSLNERGLKVTLNLHPADGVRFFEDMYEEMAKAVGIDPTTEEVVRFDITDPKFINAYFRVLHKPYEHDGVEFWWMDWQQGCQTKIKNVDPLWCLNHFHTLDNAKEHAPLLLSRYCGIGSHRYPLGFSGDTHITWETLDYLPYFTANASNVGYTWWSHDIGGHMYGINSGELYARFVQFGVFSPINRLHDCSRPFHTKEPIVYTNGGGLIAEEFLRLRHRLIPYLYTASYETAYHGRALMEPMYYEYPNEDVAYKCKNQYFFGTSLLVAPVTTPAKRGGLALTKVWLPKGHWTDIFTGDEYDGDGVITMARWLDSLPVLLKEGGILPLDGRRHTNDVSNPDMLEILVANGNGSYTLREEKDGVFAMTTMTTAMTRENCQTFSLYAEDKDDVTPTRTCRVEFRNLREGMISVTADGEPYPYAWDDDGYLSVTIAEIRPGVKYTIEVVFPARDPLAFAKERYLYSLQRLAWDNIKKTDLYNQMVEAKDTATMVMFTEASDLTPDAKARFKEQLPLI